MLSMSTKAVPDLLVDLRDSIAKVRNDRVPVEVKPEPPTDFRVEAIPTDTPTPDAQMDLALIERLASEADHLCDEALRVAKNMGLTADHPMIEAIATTRAATSAAIGEFRAVAARVPDTPTATVLWAAADEAAAAAAPVGTEE